MPPPSFSLYLQEKVRESGSTKVVVLISIHGMFKVIMKWLKLILLCSKSLRNMYLMIQNQFNIWFYTSKFDFLTIKIEFNWLKAFFGVILTIFKLPSVALVIVHDHCTFIICSWEKLPHFCGVHWIKLEVGFLVLYSCL